MKEEEANYLKTIKAILIFIGVVNYNTTLDSKSWLTYLDDGYRPYEAVKLDFEGYTIPRIIWSKVSIIKNQLL